MIEKRRLVPVAELVERLLGGDTLALGRAVNLVENGSREAGGIIKAIHGHTGRAHRIGVTGVPGIGKSTIIDKLTSCFRQEGATVGVIAVDPSSPFSGGAILGDRIRMQQHYLDRGVFIRSMATRGNQGGLPRTIGEVTDVVDASGKDVIIIETVGVGQAELDIVKNVDTVVVILAPGLGDSIQAMKAGLLEIADIFVINKSDQPGASELAADINSILAPVNGKNRWEIPVIMTQAKLNVNVHELQRQIAAHYRTLQDREILGVRRERQRREYFLQILGDKIKGALESTVREDEEISRCLDDVASGRLDMFSATEAILDSGTLFGKLRQRLTAEGGRHPAPLSVPKDYPLIPPDK